MKEWLKSIIKPIIILSLLSMGSILLGIIFEKIFFVVAFILIMGLGLLIFITHETQGLKLEKINRGKNGYY